MAQNPDIQALIEQMAELLMPRQGSVKSIPCSNFKIGDDFCIWLNHFTDNVRAVYGMDRNDQRLNSYYCNWLSTKLDPGPTRTVYDNLPIATKDDWELLKAALMQAFKDESEEIKFVNNEGFWKRTSGMSLREYKNWLTHLMDKYQNKLKAVPAEWDKTAVRRFRAGLSDPLLEAHILMKCTGDAHTLENAYEVASNWESTMQHMAQNKPVSAGASLASVTTPLFMLTASAKAITAAQTTTNDQLCAFSLGNTLEVKVANIEMNMRKYEIDMADMKASITELNELMDSIGEVVFAPEYQQALREKSAQLPQNQSETGS